MSHSPPHFTDGGPGGSFKGRARSYSWLASGPHCSRLSSSPVRLHNLGLQWEELLYAAQDLLNAYPSFCCVVLSVLFSLSLGVGGDMLTG